MESYKISIITPNFNYSKYIGYLIESVLSQNYENLEFIIVDDGSTDNSIEIIEKYIKLFPDKIKLIKQPNKGQTVALNNALNAVTGDIIGWINSDDLYEDGVFYKIANAFINDKTIDAVFGNIEIIDENGYIIKKNRYLDFDYCSGVFNGFGKLVSSNSIFWRKCLSDEVGLFNEDLIYAMDSEYWSRLLFKRKVKHMNLIFSKFRWHSSAKTITRREKGSEAYKRSKIEDYFVFYQSYKRLWISKLIPVKYSFPIQVLYKSKRFILRLINGHYRNEKK